MDRSVRFYVWTGACECVCVYVRACVCVEARREREAGRGAERNKIGYSTNSLQPLIRDPAEHAPPRAPYGCATRCSSTSTYTHPTPAHAPLATAHRRGAR